MSKIIYYIGAGASYGKNDARELIGKGTDNERLLIHEGLPVINEIGKCLLSFKEAVVNTPIDTNFDDFCMVDYISKHREVDSVIQLIEYYDNLGADTSAFGYKFTSRLSYAWETSDRQKLLFDMLQKVTSDTTTIVVIGYSFPYFNRQIDRKIFAAMPYLKTVYIQDPNPEAIEPSLRAVLQNESATKIVYQKDCTQFYLPREL